LARALVAQAPVPVAGQRVLDLGAGTGVAGRAALAAGAKYVVAADLAPAMLRLAGPALRPVAADAAALPFRDGSFDLTVAAFFLNHVTGLVAQLREVRRVAPALAASTFAAGWSHPAKDAVDEVLRSAGFRPPPWHAALKGEIEPLAGNPGQLAECAEAAGFMAVRVRTAHVATGLASPAQLASWRLGMAHVARFLNALDEPARAALRQAAERAVAAAAADPLVVPMVILTAGKAPGVAAGSPGAITAAPG
jgi:SAM-dependent methyltransferase